MAKPYIITGLDIGTGFIKMLAVSKKSSDDDFEIVGFAQAPSLGIRRGVVVDVPKVSAIISSLKNKISQDSGYPIENVYANMGGSHIFCTPSKGLVSVSRADQKISEEDIDRVLKAAEAISLSSNKEIIDVMPKEFIVDGGSSVKDALGMEGVRLEAEALVLCGFSPYIKNSSLTVLGSGLGVNDMVFSSLASARSVLTSRERELGVCVLDIGAGTTDMAVFEEGGLIHAAVFPIGSGHITNDIAICLKTDIDTAERIKLEFGSCLSSFKKGKEKKIKVDFKEEIGDEGSLVFSKRELSNIIEARVAEIFDLTNRELKSISKQGMLPAGIILTGGGAKLPGIKEMAKKQLKLPCRVGTSKISYNFQEDPSLSVLCGLVLEGIDAEKEHIKPIGKGILGKFKKMFRVIIP
jgi:cell division protein FtsA